MFFGKLTLSTLLWVVVFGADFDNSDPAFSCRIPLLVDGFFVNVIDGQQETSNTTVPKGFQMKGDCKECYFYGGVDTATEFKLHTCQGFDIWEPPVGICDLQQTCIERKKLVADFEECGRSNPDEKGGREMASNELPWLVYLRSFVTRDPKHCAGALLNSRWVMTTSACIMADNGVLMPNVPGPKVFVRRHAQGEQPIIGVRSVPYDDLLLVELNTEVGMSKEIGRLCLPDFACSKRKDNQAARFPCNEGLVGSWSLSEKAFKTNFSLENCSDSYCESVFGVKSILEGSPLACDINDRYLLNGLYISQKDRVVDICSKLPWIRQLIDAPVSSNCSRKDLTNSIASGQVEYHDPAEETVVVGGEDSVTSKQSDDRTGFLELSCDDGYEVKGLSRAFCTSSGLWSDLGRCLPISTTPAPPPSTSPTTPSTTTLPIVPTRLLVNILESATTSSTKRSFPPATEAYKQRVAIGVVLTVTLLAAAISLLALTRRIWRRRIVKKVKEDMAEFYNYIEPMPNFQRTLDLLTDGKFRARVNEVMIHSKNIQLGEKIGHGNFGVVFLGQFVVSSSEQPLQIAAKNSRAVCNSENVQQFLNEALMMYELVHENVLGLLGVAIINGEPFIVSPFMAKGSLSAYLRSQRIPLCLEKLLNFAKQISDGMNYLSTKQIIHRDLACRNVLVSSEEALKIADFGMAKQLRCDDEYYNQRSGCKLPLRWHPPESLARGHFASKSDVWSYGVVLWEIFTHASVLPYHHLPSNQVLPSISNGYRLEKPDLCPKEIYDKLMKNCWHYKRLERPSFAEISEYFEHSPFHINNNDV